MSVNNFSKFEHSKDEFDNVAPIVQRLNNFINKNFKNLYQSQENFLHKTAFDQDINVFKK